MFVPITAFYASLLALFSLGLSINVIRLRRLRKVSLKDGGHKDLLKAIRAHGNFFEYVPIAIIFMGIAEINNFNPTWLGFIGGALFFARIFHAIGIYKTIFKLRATGTLFTFSVILFFAINNLLTFITQ